MTTEKYDLHEIDYSVQGWDTILGTDMEQLDDVIPSREIVTLGETVAEYEALYQDSADEKWYKAQADGTQQPCQGLALEAGDADDEVRIHRMGLIENVTWAWATISAPIYLDPSTPGDLTQTAPSDNVQIIGYAYSATEMIVMIGLPNIGGQRFTIQGTYTKTDGIPNAALNLIAWEAPFACTLTNVKGYRVGGTGATINARHNGANNHLAVAKSLTSADQWMDGGAVQNTAYAAGDKLEFMIVTTAGGPTQLGFLLIFTRP